MGGEDSSDTYVLRGPSDTIKELFKVWDGTGNIKN